MAQGFEGNEDDDGDRSDPDDRRHRGTHDPRDPRDPHASGHAERHAEDPWSGGPGALPNACIAAIVLKLDESITLKRTAAAAWLTAHGDALPSLPIKPTRIELAIIIALAETYGAALYRDARYVFILDFIADHGAVELVQRVMYGTCPETDFDVTAFASKNALLADTLRDARLAFEFLCATWPEVFLAQSHALLAGIGVQVRPPEADLVPPDGDTRFGIDATGADGAEPERRDDVSDDGDDQEDEDGEGDHA